jgi:hypothetical protein
MNPRGRLIAQWYVFCNLCSNQHLLGKPRTTSVKEAEKRIRADGWVSHREMVMGERLTYWTCPSCAADRKRFFEREKAIRQRRQSRS